METDLDHNDSSCLDQSGGVLAFGEKQDSCSMTYAKRGYRDCGYDEMIDRLQDRQISDQFAEPLREICYILTVSGGLEEQTLSLRIWSEVAVTVGARKEFF